MKTKYLFFSIICILFSIPMNAQPIMTSADIINGTFQYTTVSFNQGVYNPSNGGANVTWDFSNIQGTTGEVKILYGNCSSAVPECASFPTANVYAVNLENNGTQNDVKNLFKLTSTQFEILGSRNIANDITVTYTDTSIELKFPTTYLQSFTDSSSSTVNNVITNTNSMITADGYGTLKTPAGTYTNVLRIKKESTISVGMAGSASTTTQVTTYAWYKNNRELIAAFSVSNLILPVSQALPSVFQYTNNNVLATEESKLKKSLMVYPNPVKDGKLWIDQGGDCKIKSVTIYDMTGKQIFAEDKSSFIPPGAKYGINLQNYAEGSYIVKIETDKNTITETIQVK